MESRECDIMIRPSIKLMPYVDFDNGKLSISEELPKELEKEVKEFKKAYENTQKKDDLAEY